jgi:hypothetical protein
MLATGAFQPFERRSRPVKRHIWRGFSTVNGFFQFCFSLAVFCGFLGVGPPLRRLQALESARIAILPGRAGVTLCLP